MAPQSTSGSELLVYLLGGKLKPPNPLLHVRDPSLRSATSGSTIIAQIGSLHYSVHHCNSSCNHCTLFLTQMLHVLINKQWLFYFHCYTALVIAKVIVQNNNNHVNQWTMYFARWHYHLPVCPSRFWFIERLLGAARPLTFASLPKKIKM